MAKHRITQTTPYHIAQLRYSTQRALADAGVRHLNVRIYVTLLCKYLYLYLYLLHQPLRLDQDDLLADQQTS